MRTKLEILLLVALHFFAGCGNNDAGPSDDTTADHPANAKDGASTIFRYSPAVPQSQRQEVIGNLQAQLVTDKAALDKLVQTKANAESFRDSLSPTQQLERLDDFNELDQIYKQGKDQIVHDVVRNEALLELLRVNDGRTDQLVTKIRNAYRKKYASKYDVAYVNELLSGRVHKPAEMLAYKISDHVVEGIRARYSSDHILESSSELQNRCIAQIIDEIGRKIMP